MYGMVWYGMVCLSIWVDGMDGCMHVCRYVGMYVRMYVCRYVCMYVHMYVCTYVCMYYF